MWAIGAPSGLSVTSVGALQITSPAIGFRTFSERKSEYPRWYVTVSPSDAAMADRVGLIREGRLDLVDSVENLRAAFTHVEATFAEPPPADAFAGVAGLERVEQDGSVVRFALEGEIDALLKALARFHVKALDVREADLEDVFLARYRGEGPDAP